MLRDGKEVTVPVGTEETTGPDGKKRQQIGIQLGVGFIFPISVTVNISDNIGGPSAGLIFALSIYDTLTAGSLTGGQDIAGTGELDSEGVVGPIGGIQQKIAGAREAGAELFLVPGGQLPRRARRQQRRHAAGPGDNVRGDARRRRGLGRGQGRRPAELRGRARGHRGREAAA